MKVLKYILFLFLVLIIGASVYYGTQDGNFTVIASKTIDAPASLVYNQVNDFKNWQYWGPWKEEDPQMEFIFSEITKGEGGAYSWESETQGNGKMETLRVIESDSIIQKIIFQTPIGESVSDVHWAFNAIDQKTTQVTWGMKGEHSFLEKIFMSFQEEDFKTTLKQMFDKGLTNIDTLVKKEMNKHSTTVEGLKDYGGGYYLFTTRATKINELSENMAPMLTRVATFMEQNAISQSGMPFTIYNQWDEENGTAIYSTAIPVSERIVITEGDVLCGFMEPLTAVKTILKGNYEYLSIAHGEAMKYIKENNLLQDPTHPMFEVYSNDPGNFPNPADWVTEIYYPVFKDLRSNHPVISGNE